MPQPNDSVTSRRRPVFISFASEDLDLANRILAALEAHGIACWIAHRDIGVAESYPAAIGAALESSGAVLLLLTAHSNRSPHVRREVEMAFNAQTPILPIRMSGILPSPDLRYFLSTTQWLDAGATFDDDEAARLREVLGRLLDRKTLDDDAWEASRRRRRRIATAVSVATVAIAIAALVLTTLWRGRQAETGVGEAPVAAETAVTTASTSDTFGRPTVAPGGRDAAGTVRTALNPRDGAPYVWIPPGEFVMGCSPGDGDCAEDERPTHTVSIRNGFWLGRTEVTAAKYNTRPSGPPVEAPEGTQPASGVSWMEAKQYCAAMGGRLPTEAEWEYAARAGTTTRFYAAPSEVAWYESNSDERPQPVGTKAPNAFGLHDMLGNVAEWVRDRYYNAYDDSGEPAEIEEPLASNASGVARGGHWASDTLGLRVSRRLEMWPDAGDPIFGFRCAHDSL
jgi:formylglycine-generating enzyme required for sulfatase activity